MNNVSLSKINNPIRLSQQDTPRLPHRYLVFLALVYIIPGLIWRGLWRQEATSFGVMLTMAQGSLTDWLLPNVAGEFVYGDAPLPYWIGALFIKLFSLILPAFNAVQIAIAVQDALAIYFLWHAIYRLGRHPHLQPQRLAFGGEPAANEYGRMLADSAVLLLIATYGIAAHTHDVSNGATQLMCAMLWLFGACSALSHPQSARWLWGLGLAGLGLSLPFSLFIGFVVMTLIVLFFTHWREHSLQIAPMVLLIGISLPLLWVGKIQPHSEYATAWALQQHFAPISERNTQFLLRNLFLFAWPLWPLALVCVWRWRAHWHNPMMLLGVLLVLLPSIHLALTGQRFVTSLLMFTPGLLLLAPFGLATLNRGRANIIDWFSLFTFSILAIGVWVLWETSWLGYPAQLYQNIIKLAPDFTPKFKWWPFGFACLVSISWAFLLRWRIRYEPRALWKSVALSSGGLVMVWVLLATLAMPWLDYTRSYERVGAGLSQKLPVKAACVQTYKLPIEARAAMLYYANVSFVPEQANFAHIKCPYLLTTNTALKLPKETVINTTVKWNDRRWAAVWGGERFSERRSILVLLRAE